MHISVTCMTNLTNDAKTKSRNKRRNHLKIYYRLTCVIVIACTTKLNKILACFWYLKYITKLVLNLLHVCVTCDNKN